MTSTDRSKKHREMVKKIIRKYTTNFIKYADKFNEKEIEEFQSIFTDVENKYINKIMESS